MLKNALIASLVVSTTIPYLTSSAIASGVRVTLPSFPGPKVCGIRLGTNNGWWWRLESDPLPPPNNGFIIYDVTYVVETKQVSGGTTVSNPRTAVIRGGNYRILFCSADAGATTTQNIRYTPVIQNVAVRVVNYGPSWQRHGNDFLLTLPAMSN